MSPESKHLQCAVIQSCAYPKHWCLLSDKKSRRKIFIPGDHSKHFLSDDTVYRGATVSHRFYLNMNARPFLSTTRWVFHNELSHIAALLWTPWSSSTGFDRFLITSPTWSLLELHWALLSLTASDYFTVSVCGAPTRQQRLCGVFLLRWLTFLHYLF